jgi:GNAT superfamily N-acetyltransferase
MLEAAGLAPEMDLYAYRIDPFAPPELVMRILHRAAMQNPRITVRSFDRKNLRAELAVMVDIFNDAWRENWGYLPLTKEEFEYLLGDLRLFFRGYYGTFVCWDGVPVGFCLIVPDVNGIIAEFDGRLMPLNWLRLIYSLTFNRFRSMRMPLLGLRRSFQGTLLGTQIFAALYTQAMAPLRRVPSLSWLEFSWVLASNRPLVTFLHSILGNPVKTYRIYAGALPLADPAARQNT